MTAKPQYDGRLYSQAEVDRMIVEARLNEAQILYEDAINSTSHGHIVYARKRVERHLETLKEYKEK